MTTEVHTLRFGTADYFDLCVPSLERWCKSHKYQITVWDDSHGYEVPKFVEMDMIAKFLKSESDRMIYIDADVFIHPSAPKMPAFKGLAIANDKWHDAHAPHFRKWIVENYGKKVAKVKKASWKYCNAGVWSLDRQAAVYLYKVMQDFPMIEFFQEQHWFNLCAFVATQEKIHLTELPNHWNRCGRDLEPSWFWHLWGNTKLEDFAAIKEMGLLTLPPTMHRYSVQSDPETTSEKVITIEFIQDAGLGNQLFEWAAGYSLARTLNLPFRWIWKPSLLREFGLKDFGIGENPVKNFPKVMQKAGQGSRKLFELAKKRINDHEGKYPTVSSPFQDEKCFIDHADEIREIFNVEKFDLPNPEGTTPVGMQVRRGDYVKHPRLNVTTPEYFTNAMRWMRDQIDNPHFIVVSDEPEWCHQFFGYLDDVTIMPPQRPFDGIRTLASCQAHIISNSTFGWWGAWLGESGPVVVPELWHLGGKSYGDWDPIPDRWQRIPIGGIAGRKEKTTDAIPVVVEKELPKHEKAIVFPWHADLERWHELRYSLRSIEKNFEDKDCPIYILGTSKPSWLIEGKRVRYIGAYTYREALMKGVQLADKVLWMNDDIIMANPVRWEDCERTLYLSKISPDFTKKADVQTNPWREGCLRLLRSLEAEGVTDMRVYSTHTPYVYLRDKAVSIMQKYGTWEKFPMELAYFHHHAVDPVQITWERATTLPADEALFLNYSDRTLTAILKKAIADKFTDIAPWELNVRFAI